MHVLRVPKGIMIHIPLDIKARWLMHTHVAHPKNGNKALCGGPATQVDVRATLLVRLLDGIKAQPLKLPVANAPGAPPGAWYMTTWDALMDAMAEPHRHPLIDVQLEGISFASMDLAHRHAMLLLVLSRYMK
jgi:hypothetical protein